MGGAEWVHRGYNCNPAGYPGMTAWLGMCFFWMAFLYSLFWYCCDCCALSTDVLGCGGAVLGPPHGLNTNQVYYQRHPAPAYGPVLQGIPITQGALVASPMSPPPQPNLASPISPP